MRKFLYFSIFSTLAIFLIASNSIYAQDDCGTATPIIITNYCTTVSSTSINAATNGAIATDGASAAWFQVIAPSDATFTVASCLGGVDTEVAIHKSNSTDLCALAANPATAEGEDDCELTPGGNAWASQASFEMSTGNYAYVEWGNQWSNGPFNWNITYDCAVINNVITSSPSITEATVTFDAPIDGSGIIVEYGPTGFTQGTGTVVTNATSPLTFGGLLECTSYDVYYYADCLGLGVFPPTGTNCTFNNIGQTTVITQCACGTPSGLTFTDGAVNGEADVSWANGGGEGNYTYEWGGVGFTPGIGISIGSVATTNTTATIAGLNCGASYEVYVKDDCPIAGGTSAWFGPQSATIDCPPQAPNGVVCTSPGASNTIVFSDEMDNLATWTGNTGAGNGLWGLSAAGTTSTNTGPTAPHSGGGYFYYEASGGTTATASLVSPAIDLTSAVDAAELTFFMHAYGVGIGTLNVNVGTAAAGPFTTEYTWSGEYQTANADPWYQVGVDLSAYIGQIIYIEFSHTGINNFDGDMAIDLVEVTTCAVCTAPTAAFSIAPLCGTNEYTVKINITDMGNAASLDVEDGGGNLLTTVTVPSNITVGPFPSGTTQTISLIHDSNAACDVTQGALTYQCPPTPPSGVTCTSPGASTIAVFSDDMETNTGWTGNIGTANGQWDFPTAGPGGNSTNTGPSGPQSGTTFAEFEASGINTTIASMVTPAIDLTSFLDAAELTFYMHAFGADIGTLNIGVGTSPAGPFATAYTWAGQFQTAAADPWAQIGVNLDAYLGQNIYIEFSYGATGGGFEGDMAIDLVEVTTCISCTQPTATFTVVPDCANSQFTIDVNITDLGDGAPLSISDGTTTLVSNISATGIEVLGPFPDGTNLDLTILHNSNAGCNLGQTGLTALCGQSCNSPSVIPIDYCFDFTGTTITDASGTQVATDGDGAAWFSFVAPANGSLNANSCNGGADTEVAIHDLGVSGDCAGAVNPATVENDDACATGTGSNFASDATITVVAGNTYAVEWGDQWSNGPFDWSISFDCGDGQVTALAANATSETTADINFTSPGASNVVLEYGVTGFTPGTGTLVAAATSPYTINTGLAACGTYDVYVNYDCLGTGVITCKSEVITFNSVCPCPEPTGATAVDAAIDGEITVSWTNGGGDGFYDLEWGTTGFSPGTGAEFGNITNTTNTTETISGLTCDLTYDVYIRDNCAGPPAGTSIWILASATVICPPPPPVGVTCTAGSSVAIFSDDMETGTGWTGNIGTTNGQWDFPTVDPGGNSAGTGPSGPQSGTTYAEYEASGNSSTIASMVSPAIDLSGGNDGAELTFYMHAFGADIGTLNVGIGNSATGPFTNLWSWSGEYQTAAADPWNQVGLNIDAYLGQTVFIEFSYGGTGAGFEGDMAIDLVEVYSCVACTAPTATFTVVPDCAFSQFTIDVDITDLGDGAPLSISDGTTTLVSNITATGTQTIGPLANGTSVDLTIVHGSNPICDVSQAGLSANCGQECGLATPIAIDYCVDITGTTIVNATNTQVATDGDGAAWFSFVAPANGSLNVNSCNGGADTEVAIHDLGVSGDCAGTVNPATVENDDACATGTGNNFASDATITVVAGNTYAVEWGDQWSNGPFNWSIAFDCTDGQVSALTAAATGETSADITFTSPGASNVILEYGPTGFTPGTGTLVAAATSPYTINTGLAACNTYDVYVNYDCLGTGVINTCRAELVSVTMDCPCGEPTGVTAVDGSTDGEATVSWTNGGGDGSYDVEWGLTGFTPGTGTEAGSILATANTSETLTGLTCAATYDVYVRDNCAGPPAASSIWSVVATVTVSCAGETCAEPIILTLTDYCLSVTGTTIVANTGSQVATDGNGAAWYAINMNVAGNLNVNSCNDPNTTDTEVAIHNGGFIPGNCVAAINPATAESDDNCGLMSDATVATVAGNTYFIEWGNQWSVGPHDWEIVFSCTDGQVTGLTSAATGETTADVTFTSPGASNVVLEYGPTGFTPGTGTVVAAATSPHNIVGLSNCTAYDVYVNYDCLATGTINDCVALLTTFNTDCPCGEPTGLTAVDAAIDGEITISYINGGGEGSYDIEWGAVGFTPGTGTEVGSVFGTANLSETASGLSCSITYDVYVRDNCPTLPATSLWVGPVAVTVICPPPPPVGVTCTAGSSVAIFSDDMETGTGWTGNIGTANGTWRLPNANPGGNSAGTGPSGSQSGTTYAEYEASGNSSTIASMVSPAIDLSGGNDGAELTFWMHAFGADIGTLNVGISNSATGPFTNLWSWSGEYQTAAADPWNQVGLNIDAYLGQTVFVEFSYGGTGAGFEGDLAIDLVQVYSCVSCTAPTATFTVVPDCPNNQFSIDINITDLGDGAPLSISDGTTTLVPNINATGIQTIGPLANGTSVDLTIVHSSNAICDVSQTGLTANCGQSCATPTNIAVDYCLDFTGTTITNATGSQVATDGDGAAWFSFVAPANASLNVNSCNGGADTEVAIHDLGVSGDCAGTVNPATVENDDACATGTGSNFASDATITVVAGNTYAVEWGDQWSNGPFNWSIAFDCTDGQVSALAAAATGETTADITFTSPGASDVVLEYGPTGFTPGTGTTVTGVTSPYNLTGLTSCTNHDVYVNYDCLGTGVINPCKAEMISVYTDCPCGPATVGLPAAGTFNAVQYCDDVSGWTYYRDPANPGESLFAIEWDPASTGNNAAAQSGSTVTIVVDPAPTMVDDGTEATWSMARYWNVNPGAAVVDPVNIKFFYDPVEKTAIENAMNADGRPVEGFDWFKTDNVDFDPTIHVTGPNITGNAFVLIPAGTGQENGIDYVQFDGITSFSGGTGATGVGPANTPVPVELLYFTGKAEENGNLLNWETASESNNSHFEVESSIDGNEFRKMASIEGNGTSSENHSYSYTDPTDYIRTYYRLKQVDFDGSYEYSNTVIVRRVKRTSLISIHPNPSKGEVYLTLLADKNTDVTIKVTDVLGRVISTEILTLNGGEEVVEMNYSHFAIGTYYISIDDGKTQIIQKWVKH